MACFVLVVMVVLVVLLLLAFRLLLLLSLLLLFVNVGVICAAANTVSNGIAARAKIMVALPVLLPR